MLLNGGAAYNGNGNDNDVKCNGIPPNGPPGANFFNGLGGDDTLLTDNATLSSVNGGDGNDSITLNGPADANDIGVVNGGAGDDFIQLDGADITGDINGDAGDDTILVVDENSDVDDVLAGVGDDDITLLDGTVAGNVFGGSDDDSVDVVQRFDFDDLGGGAGNIFGDDGAGDTGDDALTFFAWRDEVNADRLQEFNTVNLDFLTEATFTGGTLQTGGPSNIEVFIDDRSALLLNNDAPGGGNLTIAGNLTNEGLIDLSSNDGGFDNVLTVTGNYAAASDLVIDTFLNDGVIDVTDQLQIDGNATGETLLTVIPDPASPGGLTGDGPTDGILVVGVGGDSDDDAFSLTNADLVAGIFKYELVNPEGQPFGRDDWYLQSDWLDQIYVYETLPGAMQTIGLALTGQLVERVGVRSAVQSPLTDAAGAPVAGGAPVDTAVWARAVGSSLDSEGDLESTTGGNFNQTIGFVQGGAEVVVSRSDAGRFLIGALGHWGTSTVDVNDADNVERGSADFDYYGGGLTATWYGTSGLYLDLVGQYTAYDIDVSTTSRFSSVTTDGWGVSVSGEAGYRIPVGATTAIVPQAQLIWQTFEFDDFTDPDGVRVSYGDDDSLVGRLGVAVENNAAIGSSLVTGYLEANLLHEFLGDNTVNTFTDVGGTIPISQDLGGTSVEVVRGLPRPQVRERIH
ncbi:MAG: autotransporter outer membrane beta-barrel domain-containing protein [Pseudomonadota bacterium]